MARYITINKQPMKTYILQKDLPDVKAGAEFKLGRDSDAYYLTSNKTGTKYNCYCYPKSFVENNSEWFKEVPDLDKPPLGLMPKYLHDEKRFEDIRNAMGRYADAGKVVPQEWIDEEKELMEKIKFKEEETTKKYTEKELLEAEEKAFDAGSTLITMPIVDFSKKINQNICIRHKEFKSFSDYKNDIRQSKITEEAIRKALKNV